MKSLLIILFHFLLNTFFGLAVLRLLGYKKLDKIKIIQAFTIGMFVESALGFVFLYQLMEEYWSLVVIAAVGVAYMIYGFLISKELKFSLRIPEFQRPKLLDLGLMILIGQKILSTLYSLIAMPLYFDDAMTHWNGRARAIYGNVNWSVYSDDIHFMGQQLGYKEYPFLSSIWRANSAHLNGSWNDVLSRGDGFIFFIILLYGIHSIAKYFKTPSWLALSTVFVTVSLPLEFYHVTSGYSEITLQALSVLALYCLLQRQWSILGLMLGAIIFTKNEGLLLYFPIYLLLAAVLVFLSKEAFKNKVKSFMSILAGALILVLPWLSFKLSAGIPFSTPLKPENYYHEGSFGLFLDAMFNSASSSIFWIFFFLFTLVGVPIMLKSKDLRFVFTLVMFLLSAMLYIFCFTGANVFLVNQMTIHRSLLQVAPLAIVFIGGILATSLRKTSTGG